MTMYSIFLFHILEKDYTINLFIFINVSKSMQQNNSCFSFS